MSPHGDMQGSKGLLLHSAISYNGSEWPLAPEQCITLPLALSTANAGKAVVLHNHTPLRSLISHFTRLEGLRGWERGSQ